MSQSIKEQTDKEKSLVQIQATQELSIYSGPLPPPEQLIQYNNAVPNAADRILKMTERQLEHRIRCEELIVKTLTRNDTYGLICGFVMGMTTVICGTLLAWHGSSLTGFGLCIAGIGTLIGVFMHKEKPEKKKEPENTLVT